jgi:hypothetical protein
MCCLPPHGLCFACPSYAGCGHFLPPVCTLGMTSGILFGSGAAVASAKGFLVQCVVIPRPHRQVVEALL